MDEDDGSGSSNNAPANPADADAAAAVKKRDLKDCVVSELKSGCPPPSGLLPLQLGAAADPARKEGFTYVLGKNGVKMIFFEKKNGNDIRQEMGWHLF